MAADLLRRAVAGAADALRKRICVVLLGIVLLAFGSVSFLSLHFRSTSEIVYEGRMSASMCVKSGACFARYELSIGNTGTATQDKIVATFAADPAKWALRHRVLDLAGDQPRAADPRVKPVESATNAVYEIENLVAGAHVILTLDCLACPADEIRRTRETPIAIQAAGTILQGEPRVTTLGRRLKLLLTF